MPLPSANFYFASCDCSCLTKECDIESRKDINQGRHAKVLRMEKSSKRGKIPPQDWPSIISRYESGETLASIARTYDCSPPAISYIVSRSRARNAAAAPGVGAPQEPQLVKSQPGGTPSPASRPIELTEIDSPAAAVGQDFTAAGPGVAEAHGGRGEDANPPIELRLFPDATAPTPLPRRDLPRLGEDAAVERPGQPRRDPQRGGNGNMARPGVGAGASQPYSEPRRTLHLSRPGGDGGNRQEPQGLVHAG